jgi:hypothetical protein
VCEVKRYLRLPTPTWARNRHEPHGGTAQARFELDTIMVASDQFCQRDGQMTWANLGVECLVGKWEPGDPTLATGDLDEALALLGMKGQLLGELPG